jgi:hypothetical protein
MAETRQEGQGLLVKDEQGNLYYLRPEILEMTRVTQEEVDAGKLNEVIGDATIKPLAPVKPLDPAVAEQIKGGAAKPKPKPTAGGTIMCPW